MTVGSADGQRAETKKRPRAEARGLFRLVVASGRHDGDAERGRACRQRRRRRRELRQRAAVHREPADRCDRGVHHVQVRDRHVEPRVERPDPGPAAERRGPGSAATRSRGSGSCEIVVLPVFTANRYRPSCEISTQHGAVCWSANGEPPIDFTFAFGFTENADTEPLPVPPCAFDT